MNINYAHTHIFELPACCSRHYCMIVLPTVPQRRAACIARDWKMENSTRNLEDACTHKFRSIYMYIIFQTLDVVFFLQIAYNI